MAGNNSIITHNCYCYWRLVPAGWSALMASMDPEQAQALKDLAPDDMALYGSDGSIVGSTSVTFQAWEKGMFPAIGASR